MCNTTPIRAELMAICNITYIWAMYITLWRSTNYMNRHIRALLTSSGSEMKCKYTYVKWVRNDESMDHYRCLTHIKNQNRNFWREISFGETPNEIWPFWNLVWWNTKRNSPILTFRLVFHQTKCQNRWISFGVSPNEIPKWQNFVWCFTKRNFIPKFDKCVILHACGISNRTCKQLHDRETRNYDRVTLQFEDHDTSIMRPYFHYISKTNTGNYCNLSDVVCCPLYVAYRGVAPPTVVDHDVQYELIFKLGVQICILYTHNVHI